MSSNEWKLPLNIAVGMHILVLLCSLYLPDLFKAKPQFADIYTVSIINIADPGPEPPAIEPPQQEITPEPTPPTEVESKKVVPIAKITKKPNVTSPKAVSLKPLRKKKKKKLKSTVNVDRTKELEKLKREKLAAQQEEKLLEERAKLAQEALEAEKKLLSPKRPQSVTASTPTRPNNAPHNISSNSGSNLLESQYFAAIVNRLHQFWALPENLQKKSDLTAVAVITIRKNGKIAHLIFESKSGDRVFDQFVKKAIRSADPLPPIPPALKRQRYEIGLRFKPGSIQ